MAPLAYRALLALLPVVAGIGTWAACGTKLARNSDVLKSVTQFSTLLTTILVGVIGLLLSNALADGTPAGRAQRLGCACLALLAVSLTSVVVSILSLEYAALGPVALGLAASLAVGTYVTVLGIFAQLRR